MEGECRAKQVSDKLGPAGKASQDQIGHTPRGRMALSGSGVGILLGIISGGWGTGPVLALGAVGGILGMGHCSQLCPGARVPHLHIF